MISLLNHPLFEHLIGYLKPHDIIDLVVPVGKSPRQIQDYFGDGSKLGVRLAYSIGNFSIGAAGEVRKAKFWMAAFEVMTPKSVKGVSSVVVSGFGQAKLSGRVRFHTEVCIQCSTWYLSRSLSMTFTNLLTFVLFSGE
jgi:dTDP-glucose pyrophosphorylase